MDPVVLPTFQTTGLLFVHLPSDLPVLWDPVVVLWAHGFPEADPDHLESFFRLYLVTINKIR